MKTISIISQKGGAGKTTLALHLATAATAAGLECIYLNAFADGRHLREALSRYFDWYNQERPHTALEGLSPNTRYFVKPDNQPLVA